MAPKVIFRSPRLTLEEDSFTLPSGKTIERPIVRHPGAAVVVPILPSAIRFVRQYRYAVGEELYEIPAGTLEIGESPLACAKRELAEEAKLRAARWEVMDTIYPTPGFCDERQHIYAALDLTPAHGTLDEDEELVHVDVTFAELRQLLKHGRIRDAKTLGSLLLASARGLIPSVL